MQGVQSERWSSHEKLHELLDELLKERLTSLDNRFNDAIASHDKIHEIHLEYHQREHEASQLALEKAEQTIDKRLLIHTEFREEINQRIQSFITREVFDKYTNDIENKVDLALSTIADKDEALIKSLINRHDTDFNSLRDLIQSEREIRKAFEGSINTWKWLAGFLGASGVAGVILLFATRH